MKIVAYYKATRATPWVRVDFENYEMVREFLRIEKPVSFKFNKINYGEEE